MKMVKRITSMMLALVVAASMFLALPSGTTKVEAAGARKSSIEVTMYSDEGTSTSYGMYNSPIEINIDTINQNIANLKSSSPYLKVFCTYKYFSTDSSSSSNKIAKVGIYATKAGKYTVSYDIVDENNAVIKSESVIVKVTKFSNYSTPFKVAKIGSHNFLKTTSSIVSFKSGKISFKMKKGYKIQKIEVGTYGKVTTSDLSSSKSNSMEYVEVKNNKRIKLGSNTYKYKYESSYSYGAYKSESENMDAPTNIRVTYTDKNGDECTTTFYVYRLINYVK